MRKPIARSSGFTLIEVVIAAVIFVIIAVAFIPRFNSLPKREAETSIERVLDILVMFAHRESTGSQQVAIWHDPETGFISLVLMTRPTDGSEEPPAWVEDRLVEPINLGDRVIIDEVTIDDQPIKGEDEWLIASVPAGGRPSVMIHLTGEDLDTMLILDSTSLSPRRIDASGGEQAIEPRESVDLDETGREHEKW
ncbi:MAG: type II secretion system protein [Phycisphaerales bacterium]|nr:type II secretion system protein [Phycisphaerales bacterium]